MLDVACRFPTFAALSLPTQLSTLPASPGCALPHATTASSSLVRSPWVMPLAFLSPPSTSFSISASDTFGAADSIPAARFFILASRSAFFCSRAASRLAALVPSFGFWAARNFATSAVRSAVVLCTAKSGSHGPGGTGFFLFSFPPFFSSTFALSFSLLVCSLVLFLDTDALRIDNEAE